MLHVFSYFAQQNMPKVKKSSQVSSSETSLLKDKRLHVYYCLCGSYALVSDVLIDRLPKRKTDNAHIINMKTRTMKLNTEAGATKIIKRY